MNTLQEKKRVDLYINQVNEGSDENGTTIN